MRQRNIVLTPFPFSDQSGNKVRPALILSNDQFNEKSEDVIVCGLTSNIKDSKYSIIIDQKDIEDGKLYEKSSIKVENLAKIKKSIIIKSFARLEKKRFKEAIKKLEELFESH